MADRHSQKALADFLSESQEVIDVLDRGLLRLDDTRHGQDADPETLNAVFRAAHSLKGLSAIFGVERMTRLAHALEERLDQVRMGRRHLDPATLDLLLAAPGVFSRIISEEAAAAPPETVTAAERLADRLLEAGEPATASPTATSGLALEDSVRAVLTEYEEHRLQIGLAKGLRVDRIQVSFDLATFDSELDDLKNRLKPIGEVISTLPSSGVTNPESLAFDVLFATSRSLDEVREAAGPGATVVEIPRRQVALPSPTVEPPSEEDDAASSSPLRAEETEGEPLSRSPPATVAPSAGGPLPPKMLPLDAVAPPAANGPAATRQGPPSMPAPTARNGDAPNHEADASLRSVTQAVRVDIAKLDRLMNLVGELVIVKTSLLRIAEGLRTGENSTTLGLELHRETRSLERKVTELQSGMLEVRMVPLGQIFDKLSRMVRKLSRELGKQIEFEVDGSDVEVDKLIVEELSDPLMHLIRNALDHAIEAPDVRARLGKPLAGKILVTAKQKGNHVVIAVEDDGAGIDERRIREVAVRSGVGAADAIAQLSRREALNLIFLPGLSTARRVTALSGRGVGMDVVKSNIAAMSGIIDLHTEVGKGTRFEITLPVTLAIIRALIVSSAGRTYAVPLNTVLEIVPVEPAEIRTIELREVMSLRGATLPLVHLDRFLGARSPSPPASAFAVVVGLAHERLGIVVDSLVGQQDVVVKSLGRVLSGIRGIAGATDLGNRRTVLVLDVGSIIEELARGEPIAQAVS